MKKEIYRRINHVLMVLGAKKKQVIDAKDESENAISIFLEPGELPKEVKASDEILMRFQNYVKLESEIENWIELRHSDITNNVNDLRELLEIIHQDMLNFINRIDNI